MALGSTLFRINVDVSNVDAGIYQALELRMAQHPSEDRERLVTRTLAHCLAYEDGLRAGRGLDEADDPALFVLDATGNMTHWIDVGHPGAERLHRASKAARRVTVVCHKSPERLVRERERRKIHNVAQIAVWLLSTGMVQALAASMDRNNDWALVRTGEDLLITVKEEPIIGTLTETTLAEL